MVRAHNFKFVNPFYGLKNKRQIYKTEQLKLLIISYLKYDFKNREISAQLIEYNFIAIKFLNFNSKKSRTPNRT